MNVKKVIATVVGFLAVGSGSISGFASEQNAGAHVRRRGDDGISTRNSTSSILNTFNQSNDPGDDAAEKAFSNILRQYENNSNDDHLTKLLGNRYLTGVNATEAPSNFPTIMPSLLPTIMPSFLPTTTPSVFQTTNFNSTDDTPESSDNHRETLADAFIPTGDAHSMIMFGYGVVSTLLAAGVGLFACSKGCAGKKTLEKQISHLPDPGNNF